MAEFDPKGLIPPHQRNLAAVRQASDLAVEGVKTATRRQAEQIRAGIEEGNALLRQLASARTPEQVFAVQAASTRWAVDQGIANSREIWEILTRSGNDAVDILTRRLNEALEEGVELVAKAPRGTGP